MVRLIDDLYRSGYIKSRDMRIKKLHQSYRGSVVEPSNLVDIKKVLPLWKENQIKSKRLIPLIIYDLGQNAVKFFGMYECKLAIMERPGNITP